MKNKAFLYSLFSMLSIVFFSPSGACEDASIDLTDAWRFRPDPEDRGVAEKWFSESFVDDDWAVLRAGLRWEDQGFPDVDGFAWYRRCVRIPVEWKDKKVWLYFGGVNDAYTLYVNGDRVNSFGDPDTRSVHEIPTLSELSRYLVPGEENLVAVQVYDWGASGGLWRTPCLLTIDAGQLAMVPEVTSYYPFDRQELVVSVDFTGVGNDCRDGVTRVELFRAEKGIPFAAQELPTPQDAKELSVVFPLDTALMAEPFSVCTSVLDADGNLVLGFPVLTLTEPLVKPSWPGKYSSLKILNNFVTELLNVEVSPADGNVFTFLNPREGWVFISLSTASEQTEHGFPRILLNSRSESLLTRTNPDTLAFEAMQFLPEGPHEVRIELPESCKSKCVLTVRAVPELLYCYYPSTPNLPEQGVYDWQYMEKHVLPHVNVLISASMPPTEEFEHWRREGRRWIGNSSLPGLSSQSPPTPEEVCALWAENQAVTSAGFSGLIVDEFVLAGDAHYRAWTDAIRRLHAAPDFGNKTFYAFCGDLFRNPSLDVLDFGRALIDLGGRFALERYLPEQPTVEESERFLYKYLHDACVGSERVLPGWRNRLVMCLGYLSAPPEFLNRDPGVNHRVFMEMQFRMLALDPAFWGLYGVMEYSASYADEEDLRWAHRLMRHYCIEGRQTWLSSDSYMLRHIQNPDFVDGLENWAVEEASPGSIFVGRMEGLSWLEGRYPRTSVGDQYVAMRRSNERPNCIRQIVKDLDPGRLYAVKLLFMDPNDLGRKQRLALRIDLSDVEWVDKYSLHAVYPSNYAHAYGLYNRDNPAWFNYYKLVFRPEKKSSEMVISDWLSPENPGGHEGQTVGFNFVEIQPFLQP